ncbi:hypothetical protein H0H93_007630, partial [Arthromyces matolae]
MAGRLTRLPRLTLFSATLPVGDNQYPRPRTGEVEEKIRVLDTCTPPGGQGNCKGTLGRPDDNPSPGQVAEREHGQKVGGIDSNCYFVDTGAYAHWVPNGIYTRAHESILGEEQPDIDRDLPSVGPACFNCGEPGHLLNACSQPINRQLVTLSRDLHTFLKAERGTFDYQRIHEVEEWRQQRLEFLDLFVPGEVRSAELRDALGGQDGDWLGNMALWGYPKGWVGAEDPRERVKEIIWNEFTWDEIDIEADFFIHGDGDALETVTNGTSHILEDDNALESEDEEQGQNRNSSGTTSPSTLTSSSTQP